MSSININRENTDIFYRYKMPAIQSKTEGRGNGIKTAILNLTDVAKALARSPTYLVKYFGFELGAQTAINEDTDRYLVNGVHESSKLQDILDGFISKYVLCGSCKNPETDIIIKKNNLYKECKACGKITSVDMSGKLSSYILKNPPKKITKGTAAASVGGQSNENEDKEESQKQGASGDADDDDEFTIKIQAEASALLKSKVEVKDDDWSVDMSAEAIAARAKNMSLDDSEVLKNSKYDEFGNWILEFGDDKSKLPSDIEIFKKLSDLKLEQDEKALQVLGQVLFDENIVEELKSHEAMLARLLQDEDQEKAFLGGIERYVGLENQSLIAKIPKILYELYDLELISEPVMIKFCTTVSKKYCGDKKISKKVRKAAKPFLTWLQTAEEESDEDDE